MNWNPILWRSLKTRVTLFTLAIFLAGTGSLALLASLQLRQDMRQLLGDQQFATVSQVATEIDRDLQERVSALQSVARAITPEVLGDAASMQRFLQDRLLLHPQFSGGTFVTRADGTAIASVPLSAGRVGTNYLESDHVASALRQGKTAVSALVVGKQRQPPVIAMATPILDARGHVAGALVGLSDPSQSNFLSRIEENRYGKTGSYFLVDAKPRLIITSSNREGVLAPLADVGVVPALDRFVQGYEGWATYRNQLGVEQLGAGKRLTAANWGVFASIPTQEAFAPIESMQQRMWLAMLWLSLLAGGLTWWMLRRELAPMLAAAKTLALWSDTQQKTRALPIARADEVGQLIGSFNGLLQTQRLQEAALHESEFRWKFAIEGTGDALWDWNPVEDRLHFSPRWNQMLGYPQPDAGHGLQDWEARVHPDDQAAVQETLRRFLDGETPRYSSEYRLRHQDGSYLWALDRGAVVERTHEGRPLRVIGTIRDITERKQSETHLRLSNQRAEVLLALPVVAESMDERAFMQHGLNQAERLTHSQIGFIHIVHDDQDKIELVTWSASTLEHYCQASYDIHYPVSQAGIWADALRRRAPVVVNDYDGAPGKNGLPPGHARLERLISVPVIEAGLVRLMAGVGNKTEPYTEMDVETMQLIANTVWQIVRQRRTENELRASEARHRLLADNATDVIWTMTLEGRYTYVSPSVERLCGYTGAEMLSESMENLVAAGSRPLAQRGLSQFLADLAAGVAQPEFRADLEVRCKDGSTVWTEVAAGAMRDAKGDVIGIQGVSRDITERRTQQAQLKIAAQVFAQGREGVTVTDANRGIVLVNQAFTEITGYSQSEVLGRNPRILSSGRQNADFYRSMWETIKHEGHWSSEIWNRRKDGTEYPEWLSVSALHDEQGQTTHYVGSFSDLSAAKLAENRIQWLSHFDVLTGLPNQTLLRDRAGHTLTMAQRGGESLTLLLVGLDHFSDFNDTLGHATSDALLVELAQRISASVREQDTVARLSGKEFALVLPNTGASGGAHLAAELQGKLTLPCHLDGQELNQTVSIGVACYPEDGGDFDALLKSALIAMHRAQADGGGSCQFYSAEMSEQLQRHDQMLKALRRAIALDQFELLYQPLADLQTGQISGMEALLRWHHPELGSVSPVQFIPLAEKSGLITDIGDWVLRRACRDLRNWLDRGLAIPYVAINVSPHQFRDNDLLAQVKGALKESLIDPTLIFLELTESALMDDVERSTATIRELRQLGVKLSLDDFGTGYSSLSYLKCFPFDKVKIDQSFVRGVTQEANDLLLVEVIVSMAHGLGMRVVAEGVETRAQCEIMSAKVCDEIQGFYFSQPVNAQAIEALFAQGHALAPQLLRLHKPPATLLLVDDEPNIVSALKRLLRRDGYTILTANCGAQGLELLANNRVDVIISDQRMPGMTGVDFLRQAKVNFPNTIRIVLSGYTELQSVTDAINEGAVYRFLTKPWDDEQLRGHVREAFEYQGLAEENRLLDLKIRSSNLELTAANREMAEVLQRLREQGDRERNSVEIAREALQHIPLPVIGVDDAGLVAFANVAAFELFVDAGPFFGMELSYALPEVQAAMAGAVEGVPCALELRGSRYQMRWDRMGRDSEARGVVVTFSKIGAGL